jgi:hypothetical protein
MTVDKVPVYLCASDSLTLTAHSTVHTLSAQRRWCISQEMATRERENLPPQVVMRLCKEIRELVQQPPEGITYVPFDDSVTEIHAQVEGPGV